MIYKRSSALFAQAEKVIPGGVNSPVRAFKAVGGTPIFIEKAQGAYLYDVDGNIYIDYNFGEIEMCYDETIDYFIKVKTQHCDLLILKKKVKYTFLFRILLKYLKYSKE